MPEIPLNIPAILASTVASMVIGFVWYGPLFGKQWMKMMKIDHASMEKAKKEGMGKLYALAALGSLLMSFVLAHSLVFASTYLDVYGVQAGLQAGFWNWLGFIAPVTLGGVLWEGKPWKLWILNNGHYLVSMLIMGVILAVWI
ncbi:MAG: DUF1761 domain-containing protein [Candidatus Peregrinibacteria bacterium]|nr:DUF1761 domain-containing protein [Candidatus Peregrinibacteria bacterium]